MIYTKAYACYGAEMRDRAGHPEQLGPRLEPSRSPRPRDASSPRGARRRCRCATSSAIWCRTWCWARCQGAAGAWCLAEGAASLWNIHISAPGAASREPVAAAEILMFNSGGMGARPGLDGLSATAFPSGV